eukprot:861160_1
MGSSNSSSGPGETRELIKEFNKMKIAKDDEGDTIPIEVIRHKMRKRGFGDNESIEHVLKILDVDGDGTITRQEFVGCFGYWKLVRIYNEVVKKTKNPVIDMKVFEEALKHNFYHVALDNSLLKMFLAKLDENSDGKISLAEIKNAAQLAREWKIFNDIDADANGTVSLKECYKYFVAQNFPKNAIDKAFKEVDKDNSKDLDFDEFQAHFLPVLHKRRRESLIAILAVEDKEALAQFQVD